MSVLNKLRLLWQARRNLRDVVRHSRPSFSQYGEDLILDKLLHPCNKGTYVDVGANHPVNGSNTFRLYLRGWNGLAIDPNPKFAKDFERHRPRDRYLTEGVSLTNDRLTYHVFEKDVFNTFDGSTVDKLIGEGVKLIRKTEVYCRPLSEIIDQYLGDTQIDVLNVDCEGLDVDVIKSIDLNRRRPTVIIVEDYARYFTFQSAGPAMRLEELLRNHSYSPLAQSAWSGIYVANDWGRLFERSNAFHKERVKNGYLPGQA